MVAYAHVQERISYGYAKAAEKVGQTFALYRAPNGINPINQNNYLQDVFVSANVSWDYMKASAYGNAVYQLIIDQRVIKAGDILVGNGVTFFINAAEPLLPTNGVQCNRSVRLTRPSGTHLAGANPYGGYDPLDVEEILLNCPVSILDKGRPASAGFKLPLDVGMPRTIILMPFLPNVEPRIGDLLDDDRGVRVALYSVEKTDFGFRCTAISEQV